MKASDQPSISGETNFEMIDNYQEKVLANNKGEQLQTEGEYGDFYTYQPNSSDQNVKMTEDY
jgi:hypothetical protein